MDLFRAEVISANSESTTIALSGHLQKEHIGQLEALLVQAAIQSSKIVLNLQSLQLVDRQAARFLFTWQERGVAMVGCHAYISRWLKQCGCEFRESIAISSRKVH